MSALSIIQAGSTEPARPWPRRVLTPGAWRDLATALDGDAELALLGLWADTRQVHALFLQAAPPTPLAVSTEVIDGAYPALSLHRPAAVWFERMIHDLWGHRAAGAGDLRPWLDHGRWAAARPLAPRPVPVPAGPEPPELLPTEDADLHQIPLGPVHGIIAPPVHLRVTAAGETVVRLEARLGYAHRGQLALMRGKSPRAAARYAARTAADATVAHSIAFARAAEAALDVAPPPRAGALRAIMAELERIAVHLGGADAVCRAAGDARRAGEFGRHREAVLRAGGAAFGHRMMMDCVVPGGVALDISASGSDEIRAALDGLTDFAVPAALAGVAMLSPGLVGRFAAGGFVGRASGRGFDARLLAEAGDYAALGFEMKLRQVGDAAARLDVRLAELAESARLLRALLADLPEGPLTAALPMSSGEGFGVAESARGDLWHWLRLDGGLIAAAFPCDPAWRSWPLLEAAMAGAEFSALPLAAASLDGSVPGVDL